MPDRWDYYEIAFSLPDGDEDRALELFEIFENLPEVKGAVFSAGNHGGHPFSNADVERATRAVEGDIAGRSGGDAWLYEMDDEVRAEFLRSVAETALTAATTRALTLPRQGARIEIPDDGVPPTAAGGLD